MMITEEKAYTVRITLTTRLDFGAAERERPITRQDAIENGYALLPDEWYDHLKGEGFDVEVDAREADDD